MGGAKIQCAAPFFCYSRLYGWKMHRISEADPADRSGKYKGGHDRLVVGIFTAMTLGLLVFFKYMDFLADSVNRILGTHVPMVQIALPVGISFYTFQIISYYVDVYRGEVAAEHNFN